VLSLTQKLRLKKNTTTFNLLFCILALFLWVFLFFYGIKTCFSFGYDEGVYLQTAFQHSKGQKLYSELFLSQPPLLIELLSLLIRVFGNNQVIARSIIFLFGLLTFIFTFLISKELFNRKTAFISVALLATSFFFTKWAKELNADIPSLTLSLGAVLYAINFNKSREIKYILLASLLFAVANGFKLLEIFFIFPIFYLFISAPLVERKSKDNSLKPTKPKIKKAKNFISLIIFRSFLHLTIFSLIFIAIIFIIIYNYDFDSLRSQVFGFGSSDVFKIDIRRAGRYFGNVYIANQAGLFFFTIAGLIWLFKKYKKHFYFFILWITSQILFHILMSKWLWPHHLIVLFPIFSMVSSFFISFSLESKAVNKKSSSDNQFKKIVLIRLITGIFIAGLIFQNVYLDISYLRKHIRGYSEEESHLLKIMEEYTTQEQLVVSDIPMATFLTGRFTDPNLVDTSYKRIATGNLKSSYPITHSNNVKLVVFWVNKLRLLQDYYNFVKTNYNLVYKNNKREIYIR